MVIPVIQNFVQAQPLAAAAIALIFVALVSGILAAK
jgi:hypothetical protein